MFGIPGDSITAIVIGVLYLKNLNPGPMIFQNQPELVTAIFIVFFIANIIMVPFGWLAIKVVGARCCACRAPILMPIIMMFCIVGAFVDHQQRRSPSSVMLAFGVLGFLMEENGFPVAPAILGIVLGPMLESNFFNSMIKADGNFIAFLRAPDRRRPRPRDDRDLGRDDLVLLARRQGHVRQPVASAIGAGRPRRRAHPLATARTGRSTVGWLPDPPPSGASVSVIVRIPNSARRTISIAGPSGLLRCSIRPSVQGIGGSSGRTM